VVERASENTRNSRRKNVEYKFWGRNPPMELLRGEEFRFAEFEFPMIVPFAVIYRRDWV
jgi:hypothetical protein